MEGERFGRYRLTELLGAGASGVVYRAEDGASEVAVKILRPESDAVVRARFLREAKLARGLESRHVAPVLEVGEEDGVTYLVLRLYRGGSLAARLRERGRLDRDEIVALAAQLGRGLDALHEREILHRDVKPSNVLLDDGAGAALADFGLARGHDSTRLTREGQLLGTSHYLAPELIKGADATRASDVYAFGCLLYECLTGTPPFAGRSDAELGYAHLVEPPPDPRTRRADLPAGMAFAIVTALEKDPMLRPTSGTALARMLHLGRSAAPASGERG